MEPTSSIAPTRKTPARIYRVNVLHICSNPSERGCLRCIFDCTNWDLRQVSNCREAVSLLKHHGPFSVILCDCSIPAAEWQNLRRGLASWCVRCPYFVVCARVGEDAAWAEAFNLGADDVVAKPLDQREVCWLISQAHKLWLASKGDEGSALATVA